VRPGGGRELDAEVENELVVTFLVPFLLVCPKEEKR
jgi:hypothetical protein